MSAEAGFYRLKTIDSYNNVVLSPAWYIAGSALPVTWKYFKGSVQSNSGINLQWATTEEVNASSYEVQRGEDAVSFHKIGSVTAFGNSKDLQEYTYYDFPTRPGTHYYRIKQTDKDEKYDYSRIISLRIDDKETVKLFPNPVTSHLNIQSEKMIYSVEAFNANGIKIHSSSVRNNRLMLDMTKYPNGIYTFKVNGERFKIVK